MQCTIIKLEIHNFMSFEHDVIDFSAHPGITTIIGVNNDIPGAANGAGKSSGPLALFYCLYGKSAIKTKNKFLKNTYTDGSDFSVTTTLNIDGTVFTITRGADNNNNSFLKIHKLSADAFTDITPSSISECEDTIIRMLNGLTADIFLKTVYLTPTLGANFFTMSKASKTEFLNLVSGTNKLYDINSTINKDINEINTDIRITDSEIISLSRTNSILADKRAAFLESLAEATVTFNDKAVELQTDINTTNATITQLHKKQATIKAKIDDIKAAKTRVAQQLQTIQLNINKLSIAERSIITKNKHIDEFISRNQTLCDSVCSECLPTVKTVLNITSMTTDKTNNVVLKTKIDKAKIQCDTELAKWTASQQEVNGTLATVTDEYNAITTQIAKLERELDSNVCRLQLIKDKHAEPATEAFSGMIDTNDKLLVDKHKYKTDSIKRRQQLSILKFATDADTIHKFVTSRFVNDINYYVSKYLNDMGVNYYCKFDNDFTYTFMTPGGEMTFDNFSSGEKMRLNIAMSFALRKLLMMYLNIDVNVIILDEYLDSSLDGLAISGITTLLTDIKQNPFYNIYLISHRKEFLSGNIDTVMTVTKTDGISRVTFSDSQQ